MNTTQSSSCFNLTAAKIGETFALCLIFVVSLAGNIPIGIIVYKTKAMRKPINFLIVNMAMSDLLYPCFRIPMSLTTLYVDSWLISGPLGQALCKLVPFLQDVSLLVSLQSLVLIAVDRFRAVVFPHRSPLISSKLCPFFILATWIVATTTWSPLLFAFKLVEYPERQVCTLQWNDAFGESSSYKNYMLAMLLVFIYSPLALIAILYIIIYVKLKTRTIPGEQTTNARQRRLKKECDVLKMSIAIVSGFAVCYLPLSVGWIHILFVFNMQSCGFQSFWLVAFFMTQAYCAINPCICFIISGNYRRAIKKLLRSFFLDPSHRWVIKPRRLVLKKNWFCKSTVKTIN